MKLRIAATPHSEETISQFTHKTHGKPRLNPHNLQPTGSLFFESGAEDQLQKERPRAKGKTSKGALPGSQGQQQHW